MYCTIDDLIAAADPASLAGWTDDEAGAEIDAALAGEAIRRAEGTVDSYCSGRYAVPFADPPVPVRASTASLAVYDLASRRLVAPPETVVRRRDAALAWLREVAEGKANVPGAKALNSRAARCGSSDMNAKPRTPESAIRLGRKPFARLRSAARPPARPDGYPRTATAGYPRTAKADSRPEARHV